MWFPNTTHVGGIEFQIQRVFSMEYMQVRVRMQPWRWFGAGDPTEVVVDGVFNLCIPPDCDIVKYIDKQSAGLILELFRQKRDGLRAEMELAALEIHKRSWGLT